MQFINNPIVMMLIVFFYFALLPFLALIHCAMSNKHSNKSKTMWIISIVSLWTPGGFIYGLFGSKNRMIQLMSVVFLVLLIPLGLHFFRYFKEVISF